MTETPTDLAGSDFTAGVPLPAVADGEMLAGHAHGEAVVLVRRGSELFAIGGTCTHYGAPLHDGVVDGEMVRCPWHHACFSLRTGEALRAPARDPLSCWRVEQRDGMAYVRERIEPPRQSSPLAINTPKSIVIVGGGAAGNAAAELLRREGHTGTITIFSSDDAAPADRPNLSKGFLAGSASDESNALRPMAFYREHDIDLQLKTRVAAIDASARQVTLADGRQYSYDALLLATGAEPVRLTLPGGDLPHVHYLRTVADSRAIVGNALTAKRAVVIGASFIGMEVAASLRMRNIEVAVVGPEAIPMEKVLGADVGTFLRKLHEDHDVTFHLGTTATAIDDRGVTLTNGDVLPADLVVIGVGVRPSLELAQQAGLAIDRGVTVNEYLESSTPGIFAAGDIARWPDPLTGERIRVEHLVVAERQGQTAARNILGQRQRFDAVPFFWTDQYDFSVAYVGHAERWDQAEIDGALDDGGCTVTYRQAGRKLAVAAIRRDRDALQAEMAFEQAIAARSR